MEKGDKMYPIIFQWDGDAEDTGVHGMRGLGGRECSNALLVVISGRKIFLDIVTSDRLTLLSKSNKNIQLTIS